MRSVIVYLADVKLDVLTMSLSQRYPRQANPWIAVDQKGDPVLYINITEFEKWNMGLGEGWSSDEEGLREEQELAARLGSKPAYVVSVDISGRHPGDNEVRTFITNLLPQFMGVVQDEYTRHFWSLTEIQKGMLVKGHPFFDYQGWYEENQAHHQEQETNLAERREKLQREFNDAMDDNTLCQLIAAGHKIEAIARLRRRTGWGLQEAKNYIDKLNCST